MVSLWTDYGGGISLRFSGNVADLSAFNADRVTSKEKFMSGEKSVFEYERTGNVLVVVPTGSLIEFRDNEIRDAYNDTYRFISEPEMKHLLIDFSKLDYFGSTFIGMLIRLAKKARHGGGEAVLSNLSDNMKGMMKTLMLLENTKTDFFWVPFDSREAALQSLQENDAKNAATADPAPAVDPTPATPAEKPAGGGGWAKFTK